MENSKNESQLENWQFCRKKSVLVK
jgi:hypothetical protein